VEGKSGTALGFPGGKPYLKLAKSQSLDITGPLTMVAWLKPAKEWRPAQSAQLIGIWDIKEAKHNTYSLRLACDPGGKLRLSMAITSETLEESVVEGKAALPAGKWSFVAGVFSPGKSMRLYVNGALDNERKNAPVSINTARHASVLIGAAHRDRSGAHSFRGAVDEVLVYREVLDEQTLRGIMADGPGPSLLDPPEKEEPLFSFGAVSDVQYTDARSRGRRQYRDSLRKLRECVEALNRQDLAFVIQLGDLIDRDFDDYHAILPIFRQLTARRYHVLGNHDFARDEEKGTRAWEHLKMPARYYDFGVKGWRFVVLDGNDISLRSAEEGSTEYDRALAILNELKSRGLKSGYGYNGAISRKQINWLRSTLERACQREEKVILFCHHPLRHYPFGPLSHNHNLWNGQEIACLIESYPCVVAYLNGHNHGGNYYVRNGVHYLNLRGMVEAEENAYCTVRVLQDYLKVEGHGKEPFRILRFTKRGKEHRPRAWQVLAPLPLRLRFRLDERDEGLQKGWHKKGFDDSHWGKLATDRWWEKQGHEGYDGVAWYRTGFDAPRAWAGKNVLLRMEAVDGNAWCYLNGKLAGTNSCEGPENRTAWYSPFSLDVSKLLSHGQRNVLAIKVEDTGGMGGIWKPAFTICSEKFHPAMLISEEE